MANYKAKISCEFRNQSWILWNLFPNLVTGTYPILICTWFKKNQVGKIPKLIFKGYKRSKSPVWNRLKIQLVELDFFQIDFSEIKYRSTWGYWCGIKNLAQGLYQKILQRWQTRYVLILYRNNSWFLTDFFPVLGWLNFCSFISRPFYNIWKLCKHFRLHTFN